MWRSGFLEIELEQWFSAPCRLIRITFTKNTVPRATLQRWPFSHLTGLQWSPGLGSFKTYPGDSSVCPGLGSLGKMVFPILSVAISLHPLGGRFWWWVPQWLQGRWHAVVLGLGCKMCNWHQTGARCTPNHSLYHQNWDNNPHFLITKEQSSPWNILSLTS